MPALDRRHLPHLGQRIDGHCDLVTTATAGRQSSNATEEDTRNSRCVSCCLLIAPGVGVNRSEAGSSGNSPGDGVVQLERRGAERYGARFACGAEPSALVSPLACTGTQHRHSEMSTTSSFAGGRSDKPRCRCRRPGVCRRCQAVLLREGHRGNGGVQTSISDATHVAACDDAMPVRKVRDQVRCVAVARRDARQPRAISTARQGRVGDVVGELPRPGLLALKRSLSGSRPTDS